MAGVCGQQLFPVQFFHKFHKERMCTYGFQNWSVTPGTHSCNSLPFLFFLGNKPGGYRGLEFVEVEARTDVSTPPIFDWFKSWHHDIILIELCSGRHRSAPELGLSSTWFASTKSERLL